MPNNKFAVSSKVYDRFIRVFQKQEKVKMYLASGYCKYHGYDKGSMDVVEYHYQPAFGTAADLRTAGHREAEGNGSGGLLQPSGISR